MKFPKVTIYDRYIFKQVLFATMVAILLFTIVWIAPEMLLNTIKGALAGEYGVKTAILMLFYELPKILGKAFPVGLLLGTLFTFDKLSKDSELTIFRATGLSFGRIIAAKPESIPRAGGDGAPDCSKGAAGRRCRCF